MVKIAINRLSQLASLVLAVAATSVADTRSFEAIRDIKGDVVILKAVNVSPVKGAAQVSKAQALTTGRAFLNSHLSAIGIAEGAELVAVPVRQDELGYSRVRLLQRYQGLPVWGKEAIVNLDASGAVFFSSIQLSKNLPKSVATKLSAKDAEGVALSAARLEARPIDKLRVSTNELTVFPSRNPLSTETDKVAYRVIVDTPLENGFSSTYFVDGLTGEVIDTFENSAGLNRMVWDCSKQPNDPACYLDSPGMNGYIHGRTEGEPARGPHNNPAVPQYMSTDVDDITELTGVTNNGIHGWVQATFGINGANNQGGTRATYTQEYQSRYAVHGEGWDGQQSPYCPGGAWITPAYTIFTCRHSVVPDIIGHEYGHAIANWSFVDSGYPLGVDYGNPQAKALDESHSDTLGEAYELFNTASTDWIAGSHSYYEVVRDLIDPHDFIDHKGNRYAARFYDEYFNCNGSGAGYYANSTVYTKAMQLAAQGGEFNGCEVSAQGMDFVNQVYHRAYRGGYFVASQNFDTAYTKLLQACSDLYSAAQCAELQKALQAVEADQAEPQYGGQGICLDPQGAAGERAPACAVNNVGSINSCWPDGFLTTTFAPGEQVWMESTGGIAGKDVDVHLVEHNSNRPVWDKFTSLSEATATIDQNGNSMAGLGVVADVGTYDVLVDGNRDGVYQPWADAVKTITVASPVAGDGICYHGQNYNSSENCHDSINDCACAFGQRCQMFSNQEYSCSVIPGGGRGKEKVTQAP